MMGFVRWSFEASRFSVHTYPAPDFAARHRESRPLLRYPALSLERF